MSAGDQTCSLSSISKEKLFWLYLPGLDSVAEEYRERTLKSLSFGVSSYPEHGLTPEQLVSAADQALHEAKRLGRNKVVAAGGWIV